MISMTSGFHLETTTHTRGGGGLFKGVKRLLSGELFVSQFDAHQDNQTVVLASPWPVISSTIALTWVIWLFKAQAGWRQPKASTLISLSRESGRRLSEGVFWIKCSGQGDIFLNSFGAIYEIEVDGGYVDTGHIVAFEDSLEFNIGKSSSGWISSIMSGEGLVAKFRGRGKVYCQTHNPPNFGSTLGPMVKPIRA